MPIKPTKFQIDEDGKILEFFFFRNNGRNYITIEHQKLKNIQINEAKSLIKILRKTVAFAERKLNNSNSEIELQQEPQEVSLEREQIRDIPNIRMNLL